MELKKVIYRSLLITIISFVLSVCGVLAQDAERTELDASALTAGQPFRFTVTVNSDELRSFADAQAQLTTVLCPADPEAGECRTMDRTAAGEDGFSMRITFEVDALPAAGDYTLDVSFLDESGEFASRSASYLLKGVQPDASAPAVTPVTLSLSMLDAADTVLYYNSTIYVGEPYTLQIRADSPMDSSVTITAELPASLQSAPLDPESECLRFLNAEGTALVIPGDRWSAENGGVFRCELRYTDRIWLPGESLRISSAASETPGTETFEVAPLNWNAYPTNVTQHPATHQAQVYDSRGNLLCSDTVGCGMFSSDEVYILTYRFPAEWGAALPSGRSFTADVTWPAEWAASLRQLANQQIASAHGEACAIDADGVTRFELKETSEGRYSASCAFNPGAITNAVLPSITIHLNDNAWAVRDLNVGLSPVIIRQQPTPTATDAPVVTETPVTEETPEVTETVEPASATESPEILIGQPDGVTETEPAGLSETETLTPEETETSAPEEIPAAETEEPLPEIEIPLVVHPVTLTPSIIDAAGTGLIYGSTLYVGEDYTLRIAADTEMDDSVAVNVQLPASVLGSTLDPISGCLDYLSGDGMTLSIPGSSFNSRNNNTFSCGLRFSDSGWFGGQPIVFSIETVRSAEETYGTDPLNWSYYPVNVAKMAATHQLQVTDGRGNLICSDNVPCGVFSADEVYTLTYKFPADWGTAMPSGKSLSAQIALPADWAFGLQTADELAMSGEFGEPCMVNPDGTVDLFLEETGAGRYSASCSFVPSGILNPVQAAAAVHLNDNTYQVNDLNLWLPGTIVKPQVSLNPSLSVRMAWDSEEDEQIRNNTLGTLYRSTEDFPNAYGSGMSPAQYTLKAQISGVSSSRSPQPGDAVLVNWPVLDHLMQTGDLPSCLQPSWDGYYLGNLMQMEDGSWSAQCDFYFPRSMDASIPGSALEMELVSGAYQTSARVEMSGYPFSKQPLYVDLDIPAHMLLMQPTELGVRLSDSSGGFSDYLRAVMAAGEVSLYNTWEYNYLTDCQGIFTVGEDGKAVCTADFFQPMAASDMHFDLISFGLDDLFSVEYRPSANIHIPAVTPMETQLTPHLGLQMTAGGVVSEQIWNNNLGTLYRSTGEFPNAYQDYSAPALYTLKAEIEGVIAGSDPQFDDQVLVEWPLLDSLAQTGDLPACLIPSADGYILGQLSSNGTGWEASCDFRFPQTMRADTSGSTMQMRLLSAAYEGEASVTMTGDSFRQETVYVDLDIPEHMLLRQMTEFHVQISDASGSLSEYLKAVLSSAGASLISTWDFNYATTCQGLYELTADGSADCSAYFDFPTNGDSTMYFELISPASGDLFDVVWRPSAEIFVQDIGNIQASLATKLFHGGEEIPLPAYDDAAFMVQDDYQLQFILTPDPEYIDVLNAVSVDGEGLVMDWWQPLLIRWDALPYGQEGLNFYRDGDHFIARYDFSFGEGNIDLYGNLGRLTVEAWIDGWDIELQSGFEPIRLPSRVERKPLDLSISEFRLDTSVNPVDDLYVDQEARFEVSFSGDINTFDPAQMIVGYDANGIRTPVPCDWDPNGGVLHCSVIGICTDYLPSESSAVCGTGLNIYAVYGGDAVNSEAEAEPKTFNVKRNELRLMAVEEGSLNRDDLVRIQSASEDLQYMRDDGLYVNGWNLDSFLPRRIWKQDGDEFGSYMMNFRYETTASAGFDETLLRLYVVFETGYGLDPETDAISLRPFMVTDDMVTFLLDFGSMEFLDDGRTPEDALKNAVTIRSLTARYPGNDRVGPASCTFEAEKLDFPLKVADAYDLETDLSLPYILQFDGIFTVEASQRPFAVYCSQLYEQLACSNEPPVEVSAPENAGDGSELTDEEMWLLQSESVLPTLNFNDLGCWGSFRMEPTGLPQIFINNGYDPKCYLAAVGEDGQILIASNVY